MNHISQRQKASRIRQRLLSYILRLKSHTGAEPSFRIVVISNGGEAMKIVNLCSCGSCCPVVKLADDHVEIGEEGNLCVLTLDEWETLKRKILDRET